MGNGEWVMGNWAMGMGHGAWGIETIVLERASEKASLILNTHCPLPHAHCPMPNYQFPIIPETASF
jgi:hypothetical protein